MRCRAAESGAEGYLPRLGQGLNLGYPNRVLRAGGNPIDGMKNRLDGTHRFKDNRNLGKLWQVGRMGGYDCAHQSSL